MRTQPITNAYREGNSLLPEEKETKKPTDSKITGVVLRQINHPSSRSALLSSVGASQAMADILSVAMPALEEAGHQQTLKYLRESKKSLKNHLRKRKRPEKPIGLRRYAPHGWMNPMNALMQFLLFLPEFNDLFNYAPRSFHYFLDFIDQYLEDETDNLSISSANTAALVRCLTKKLPAHLFRNPNKANFYEILHALIKALLISPAYCNCVLVHPERQILWDLKTDQTFEEIMKKKMESKPPELLMSIKGTDESWSCAIKKQLCTQPDWLCYDLQSFIEHRPDGHDATYITYLKTKAGWYQCDEERILPLLSNSLTIPLHRSVLLYYKRLQF